MEASGIAPGTRLASGGSARTSSAYEQVGGVKRFRAGTLGAAQLALDRVPHFRNTRYELCRECHGASHLLVTKPRPRYDRNVAAGRDGSDKCASALSGINERTGGTRVEACPHGGNQGCVRATKP